VKNRVSADPYTPIRMRLLRAFVLFLALPLSAGPRYIVEFRDGVDAARAGAHLGGARARREYVTVLRGIVVELRDGDSIEAIRRLPEVERVTPDWVVQAFDTGSVSSASAPAPRGTADGKGIVVAVIDSGIDYTHGALGGGFGPNRKVIGGYDFVNDDADPMDDNRHGTHVAGIIAAQSKTVTGLAPQAKLLAYKVLDAKGKGFSSDIIAAIDRAVTEGASVINLSLGGPGHPDDPLARAVDNATAHGVLVCVAAGNEGEFHTIGSPAGAASAITVGAADGSAVAEFSSRGPATQSGAVKPDVVAPGVSIVSTVPGGGTMALSGTSMATPHVAALAALLREAHPEWSPERIKTAIVSTALPLPSEEVMSQGAGRVDADAAFANSLVSSPSQLNFALDALEGGTWQQTRSMTLRNDSSETRTIRISPETVPAGVTVSFAIQEFSLAPGESRLVEVSLAVDNEILGSPTTQSLAFGGVLAVDSGGKETVRLPWAFLRAARSTFRYDGSFPEVYWRRLPDGYESFAPIDPNGVELLLKPGTYDFAVIGQQADGVRLFVLESRALHGDLLLPLTDADARNEIRYGAVPPVDVGSAPAYAARTRLIFPGRNGSVVLPGYAARRLLSNDFSSAYEVLVTESFVNEDSSAIVVAQHPPLRGVSSSVSLTTDASAFREQQVELRFHDDATMREVMVMPRDWPRRAQEFGPMPPFARVPASGEVWATTIYMTPEVHEDFAGGVQLATIEAPEDEGFRAMFSPMIRRDATGFVALQTFEKPGLPVGSVAGEPLHFGGSLLRPGTEFHISGSGIQADAVFRGDRDEAHRATKLGTVYKLRNAAGVELARGSVPVTSFGLALPSRGRYELELETKQNLKGTFTMRFDTTAADVEPPVFSWLSMHDAIGRRATSLPQGGNGSLVFATRNAMDSRTGVFFRRHGGASWVQLTPVVTESDGVDNVYRVDLADALRLAGEFDLLLETGDIHGNITTWLLERAFHLLLRSGAPFVEPGLNSARVDWRHGERMGKQIRRVATGRAGRRWTQAEAERRGDRAPAET
jgi:hypothetical protein